MAVANVKNVKSELKTVSAVKAKAEQGEDARLENQPEVGKALAVLLSDVFALYIKTKNYHWHMSGRHFRDYHLLLDEQADQIFAITDEVAERVRKLGYPTIHSIGEISRKQRVKDNDDVFENPLDMLIDLQNENRNLVHNMRETHEIADDIKDVATASLLEVYIDQAERRAWFLFEASREVN